MTYLHDCRVCNWCMAMVALSADELAFVIEIMLPLSSRASRQ